MSLLRFGCATLGAVWIGVVASSAPRADGQNGAAAPASGPTFSKDVAPILYKNCTSCHRPGEIGPMSLLTYSSARPYAKAIRDEISDRTMPPWHAEAPHGTFLNERSLTDGERDILIQWATNGAPEGNPKDLPAPPKYEDGWSIGKPDLVLEMTEDYKVPAEGVIQYEYFYIPTNFSEPKWVQAIEVRPGNRKVVHHALLFHKAAPDMPRGIPVLQLNREQMALPPSKPGTHPARRDQIPGRLIATYAPGTNPQMFPAGTALRLEPGGVLELQMHYTANGEAASDRTKVGLIFAKDPSPREIRVSHFYNTRFSLPAGSADTRVDADVSFVNDAIVWGLFPHTHVRGKKWEYVLELPDGTKQTILSVPRYDFNWQTYYMFAEPLKVPKGARLVSSAWYDNSAGNRANPDPKVDVMWGNQTWEEMQYTGLLFSPAPAPAASERIPAAPEAPPADVPTFAKDVAPILYKNCVVCHRAGEIGPMPLVSYGDARPWAKSIRDEVSEGHMPPWHADPTHGRFANDRSLSAADRETLVKWANGGAPQGDVKDMPAVPKFTEGWNVGTPDYVVTMPEPYKVPADGFVEYEYIEIPTNLTEDKWIQAMEVRPGNRAVVHHVILFARTPQPERRPSAFKMAPTGPQRSGGASEPEEDSTRKRGVSLFPAPRRLGNAIGGFAPGNGIVSFAPGSAMLLRAGTTLILQMHYTPNGEAQSDQTKIGFVFAKEPPKTEMRFGALMNRNFVIPAGSSGQEVKAEMSVTQDVTLRSLLPHTHLRGKSWEYTAVYPDGRSETILAVPKYDFNWQTDYVFEQPLKLPKGTIIHARATYDNSADNKSNPDPKVDVKWGDQTWEEMMFTAFVYSIDGAAPGTVITAPANGGSGGR
jgi:mono/diheme cytochrome c family protein